MSQAHMRFREPSDKGCHAPVTRSAATGRQLCVSCRRPHATALWPAGSLGPRIRNYLLICLILGCARDKCKVPVRIITLHPIRSLFFNAIFCGVLLQPTLCGADGSSGSWVFALVGAARDRRESRFAKCCPPRARRAKCCCPRQLASQGTSCRPGAYRLKSVHRRDASVVCRHQLLPTCQS